MGRVATIDLERTPNNDLYRKPAALGMALLFATATLAQTIAPTPQTPGDRSVDTTETRVNGQTSSTDHGKPVLHRPER